MHGHVVIIGSVRSQRKLKQSSRANGRTSEVVKARLVGSNANLEPATCRPDVFRACQTSYGFFNGQSRS